ncbi:MAG: hypothetical protein HRU10_07665 [Opitutales bacterium]|nr:hypothetical protein [Opitutales bacterium]
MIVKTSRLCLHCLLWAFTGFLAVLLIGQIYLAWNLWRHDRVVLPAPMVSWVLSRYTAPFTLEIESAAFRTDGVGYIENIELFYPGDQSPSLRIGSIAADLDLGAMLFMRARPEWLSMDEVEIALPAIVSPTGVREVLVSNGSIRLSRKALGFSIDHAIFFSEHLKAVVAGVVEPRWFPRWVLGAQQETEGPTAPREVTEWMHQWLNLLSQLRRVDRPVILLKAGIEDTRQTVSLFASALGVEQLPGGLEIGRTLLEFEISWDTEQIDAPELRAEIESLKWGDRVAFNRLQLRGVWDAPIVEGTVNSAWKPGLLDVAAETLELPWLDKPVDWMQGRFSLPDGDLKRISSDIDLTWMDARIALSGEIDVAQQAGELALSLRNLGLSAIDSIAFEVPESLLSAVEFSSLSGDADITLSSGWDLDHVSFDIASGPAVYHGVQVHNLVAEGEFANKVVQLNRFDVDGEAIEASGSLDFDLDSRELELFAQVETVPTLINSWFPSWWADIWKDFTFDADVPARGDLHLKTQIGVRYQTKFFVGAEFDRAAYGGAWVQGGSAKVHGRAKYTEVYDIDFLAEDGNGQGRLSWTFLPDRSALHALEYDFQGAVMPSMVEAVLPDSLRFIPAAFEFESKPFFSASGLVYGNRVRFEERLLPEQHQITLQSSGPGRAYGVGMDRGLLEVLADRRKIEVALIDVEMGGGTAGGTLTFNYGGEEETMAVDVEIMNFQKDRLFDVFPILIAEVEAVAAVDPDPRANIDLRLKSVGPLGDLFGQTGSGHLEVYDEGFAKTRVFGGITGMLENTAFPIGSLSIHRLKTDFDLKGDTIHLTRIDGEGPGARLNGSGTYNLIEDYLDLKVRLRPGNMAETPIYSLFAALLRPVTAAMPIRIWGKMGEPQWSFDAPPAAESEPDEL